jgi:hypothetical protein
MVNWSARRFRRNEPTSLRSNAQSEANLRGGAGWDEPPQTWDARQMRETNPISREVGRGRPTYEETIVRNKAKLEKIGVSGKRMAIACGHTWPGSETCETNPICTWRGSLWGQVRQTNPICRRWAGKTIVKAKGLGDATRHQGNCAKQDTRDRSLVQPDRPAISARKRGAKPNSATFVVGIKQSQFCGRARKWARAGAFRCQSCQTKPIGSPWRPYKQSQFAAGTCRARACPELAEGTPDPRSGRGQAPRRVEGDRAKQSQFRSTAGETLRLQVSGQDLQCWQRLGIALVRTSHGEREL